MSSNWANGWAFKFSIIPLNYPQEIEYPISSKGRSLKEDGERNEYQYMKTKENTNTHYYGHG